MIALDYGLARQNEQAAYSPSQAGRFRTGLREGLIFDRGVLYRVVAGYDSPEMHHGGKPYEPSRIHIDDYSAVGSGGGLSGETSGTAFV